MGKELNFIFFIILILSFVHASCDSGQIDINSASASELDELYGIGPAKAQSIIEARPFNSLDDLINVNGIGEATLEKIKSQGLACVTDPDSSYSNEDKVKETDDSEESPNYIETDFIPAENNTNVLDKEDNVEREPIVLNPQDNTKDIKINENVQTKSKNHPLIGLILFSVLIGTLVLVRKRKYKNEFKE